MAKSIIKKTVLFSIMNAINKKIENVPIDEIEEIMANMKEGVFFFTQEHVGSRQ